ncbi:MAG: hypothetical protein GC193_04140 [Cryomorphaceae bacterium]|nr:hypothetical protein [Cryomorphaceae bacterium]
MKITRENYEAYLLDFAEGVFSADQQAELFAFLEANPDLNAEFDIPLDPIPVFSEASSDWASLLKTEKHLASDLDTLLIAKLEGDYEPEVAKLDFSNQEVAAQWQLIQRTKVAAPAVSFGHYASLRIPAEITTIEEWKAALAEGDLSDHIVSAKASAHMHAEITSYRSIRLKAQTVAFGNKTVLMQEAKVVPLFRRVAFAAASIAAIFICILAWPEAQEQGSSIEDFAHVPISRPLPVVESGIEDTAAIAVKEEAPVFQFVSGTISKDNKPEPAVERERIAVLGIKQIGSIEQAETGRKLLHADDIEARDAMLYAESPKAQPAEFQTLTEYVKERAQRDILKVEPTEPVAVALVEKAVDKIEKGTDGAIKIQPSNKETGTHFNLKLGKLEISRNR